MTDNPAAQSASFHWMPDSDYGTALEVLHQHWTGREAEEQAVDAIVKGLNRDWPVVEPGCGNGDFSARLQGMGFENLHPSEPLAHLAAAAQSRLGNNIHVQNCSMADLELPNDIGLAVLIHFFYHLAPTEAVAAWLRCAKKLRVGGKVVAVLKHPQSDDNRMIEHLGAPGFDIHNLFGRVAAQLTGFSWEIHELDGVITPPDDAAAERLARFFVTDRKGHYNCELTEADFHAAMLSHLWSEQHGTSGGFRWKHIPVMIVGTRTS